jgi:hypothetical protein
VTTQQASRTDPIAVVTDAEPPWCDPALCQAEDPLAIDRDHVYYGKPIALSLYDRTDVAGPDQDFVQSVTVFVTQHVAAPAPTFGIYSEWVGNGGASCAGFELSLTREEYVALHAAMGEVIKTTA